MSKDPQHPSHRLMVVDNDPDLVDSLCEWISISSEWTVVPAYGPEQAIAQACDEPFDAILLDLEMPGADGFDTASTLERACESKHAAIVALTGNADLRDAASADHRFAASFLKPADPVKLLGFLVGLAADH
jgi:CheY-like chemotaxis protein